MINTLGPWKPGCSWWTKQAGDEDGLNSVRFAIAGLGTATRLMLHAMMRHPRVEIVAVASVREEERIAFNRDFSIPAYEDLQDLCNLDGVDAIYISTPTHLHVQHVLAALDAGKHVLVEKPLAIDLKSGQQIVDAAARAGRLVLVGHSHSYDPPIQAMREVVSSGRIGALKMINSWCFTDWLYRPRLADELKTDLGGGATFRQGAHQFDIIRYIGGGKLRSVRASVGRWDERRPTEGSHSAFLEFDNGVSATAVYSGYDHFQTSEITYDIGEWGHEARPSRGDYGARRRQLATLAPGEESSAKRAASGYRSLADLPEPGAHQPFFGITVVSCERGDIRQSPNGLVIYADDQLEELRLPAGVTPHDRVMDEFVGAVADGREAVHSAAWGLATLEVCNAVLLSAQRQEEVYLHNQVGHSQ